MSLPPFLFTYWNPGDPNQSAIREWLRYVKDTSLAEYTADCMGRYVQICSREQIAALDQVGARICGELYQGFSDVNSSLVRLDQHLQQAANMLSQRLESVREVQALTNLLLENVGELLRIPDSQKQRQHHLETGMRLLINSARAPDLVKDALHEFHQAEALLPYDYFVLQRLGMIYLYHPEVADLAKAREYLLKAVKYAAAECDDSAARLDNILGKSLCTPFAQQVSALKLPLFVADCYHHAATACYAMSLFPEAAQLMHNACGLNPQPKYGFYLAKYLARSGRITDAIDALNGAIESDPTLAAVTVADFDLNQVPAVVALLDRLDQACRDRLAARLELSMELQQQLTALRAN